MATRREAPVVAKTEEPTPMFPAQGAAEEIERMARLYEPFVAIATTLRAVGSLDNLVRERQQQSEGIQARIDVLQTSLAELEQQARDAQESNAALHTTAQEDANAVRAQAREEGERIVDAARREADRLTLDAKTALAALREDIETTRTQRADAIESNTRLMLAHDDELRLRREELQTLEARIAGAREQIAKLLGDA